MEAKVGVRARAVVLGVIWSAAFLGWRDCGRGMERWAAQKNKMRLRETVEAGERAGIHYSVADLGATGWTKRSLLQRVRLSYDASDEGGTAGGRKSLPNTDWMRRRGMEAVCLSGSTQ